jgi:hypothetical protein
MSTKVALILGGPALVTYRGQTFYSQGDITLDPSIETFPIMVDRYQQVDERVKNQPIKLSFTPAGEWEALNVLFPYASTVLGDLITPVRTFGTVVPATNLITITGHGLTSGDAIRCSSTTTLPAPLSPATLYYAKAVDPNTISLHPTYGDAIAGTNIIDITDVGTGTHKLVVNNPLVIQTFAGQQYTFPNAAVVSMPPITVSAVQTLLGQVTFECFLAEGANWSDANPFYTLAAVAAPNDTSFNPTNVLTQPATMGWGVTPPWSSFSTKSGVRVEFPLQLEAVETDMDGVLTRRLSGITVTARAVPMGLSESDIMTKLLLQGAGAARGRSLSGANLEISATGFWVRLYGAALRGGPQLFGTKSDRIGELTWVATRTFATGVPNPLFFVGTANPG